jgi:hypothetical protein
VPSARADRLDAALPTTHARTGSSGHGVASAARPALQRRGTTEFRHGGREVGRRAGSTGPAHPRPGPPCGKPPERLGRSRLAQILGRVAHRLGHLHLGSTDCRSRQPRPPSPPACPHYAELTCCRRLRGASTPGGWNSPRRALGTSFVARGNSRASSWSVRHASGARPSVLTACPAHCSGLVVAMTAASGRSGVGWAGRRAGCGAYSRRLLGRWPRQGPRGGRGARG